MNKERRKMIREAISHLNKANELLEWVRDDEDMAFSKLPDGLQCSDRGLRWGIMFRC